MKTTMLLASFVFPLLFGGTACGHDVNDRAVIVRVKNPDERAGYLGVSTQDMTHRLARSMDVKTQDGALVNDVTEESPADEAGIREEDIIVEVDGKKIADADDLREAVRAIKPDTKVNVVVMRKDERKTLAATIGRVPHTRSYSYSFTPPAMPRIPKIPHGPMSIRIFSNSTTLGMELSELNGQLGKYFEAPDGKGVLVYEVEDGSRAEKAGFQAGDVITKIGKESIEDIRDVEHALRDYKEGDKADVEIIRKGSKKTVTVEIPEMDRHRRFGFGPVPPGSWQRELELEMNHPDIQWELKDHESLKNNLRELELELRNLGRDIQIKAQRMKEELKEKLSGVMS